MTEGRGKVEEGREDEGGQRKKNGERLGREEKGRSQRRGITSGWSDQNTVQEK